MAQTRTFSMIFEDAQDNQDIVTCTMFVFGTPAQVLFNFGSSRSFVSTTFAFHADRELTPLKNKLVVTTSLVEQILRNSIFKWCEILVDGMVLKENLILLEMHD